MLTKAEIKDIRSLNDAAQRWQKMLFVVEGVKMVNELLSSKMEVVEVFATKEWKPEVGSAAFNFPLREVADWELAKLSNLTTPNKVLAVARIPDEHIQPDTGIELILLLDKISDPGNMGTIIRTAEWFGIKHIIASNDSVDFYNPKVVQASMGSVFRMELQFAEILSYLRQNAGIPVYGTLLNGTSIYEAKLTPNGIIVIGNESNGISANVQEFVTHRLTIPASHSSMAESLNASIAAAITCYEFSRQSLRKK